MGEKSKRKQIFDAVEDCVLDTANRLKSGDPINVEGLQALFDGVRILHRIQQMERENLQAMLQFTIKEDPNKTFSQVVQDRFQEWKAAVKKAAGHDTARG